MRYNLILANVLITIALCAGSAKAQIFNPANFPLLNTNQNYVELSQYTSLPNGQVVPTQFVSLDQFASTTNLNTSIAGVNTSITGLNSSVTGINASIAGINSSLTGVETMITNLRHAAWDGAALAASLTPILPTDGNQNHINLAGATADGVQAVSLNYAHVEGHYDFVAGAAVAKNYSLAKIGVGFSW